MVRKIRILYSRIFPIRWQNRVDYVEQVEEILAATHAKGARLFRRPKMSASVDRCVCSTAELCSFFLTVAALDKLHARHVLPGFADRSSEEREIQVATTDITKVTENLIPYLHLRFCLSRIPSIRISVDARP
jgi:hypothetical protein